MIADAIPISFPARFRAGDFYKSKHVCFPHSFARSPGRAAPSSGGRNWDGPTGVMSVAPGLVRREKQREGNATIPRDLTKHDWGMVAAVWWGVSRVWGKVPFAGLAVIP